jgi:hypothetical protein
MEEEALDVILEKYFTAKEKVKDLNELLSYYKEIIETNLDDMNREHYKGLMYSVERKTTETERLSKKDIPKHIVEEYSVPVISVTINVTKNGEKTRRRSRSPPRRRSRK